ncbi:hypothetical protein BGZ72_001105, partial [Mortierella alpina]
MDLRNYFSAKPKTGAAAAAAPAEKEAIQAFCEQRETYAFNKVKKTVVEEAVDPKEFFASAKTKKAIPNTAALNKVEQNIANDTPKVAESVAKKESDPLKVSSPTKRAKKDDDDDIFGGDDDAELIPKPKSRGAPARSKAPEQVKVEATPAKKAAPASSAQKKRRGAPLDGEDDEDVYVEDEEQTAKPAKRPKTTPKKVKDDSAMDIDEPQEEKPKPKFNYHAFKNRAGPSAIGSKEIPKGQDNCLAGWTFVFTGELSSIPRDEAQDLVKRYSGRVTGAPSGKTSFVVVGDDAGQSKLDKVKKLKIKTLNEDEFLDLIRTSPAKTEDGQIVKAGAASSSSSSSPKTVAAPAASSASKPSPSTAASVSAPSKSKAAAKEVQPASNDDKPAEHDLWTTKYRPKRIQDLCGNTGQISKLQRWLEGWDANYKLNFKQDNADKSGVFRAVLISGAPGVGKTSAAHLVGENLGYSIVEFNASDTRSKRSLDEQVRDLLNNQSLAGYFLGQKKDGGKGKETATDVDLDPSMAKKQLIIMDEVDGMAGGDRGGVAQLISFIKKTQVPIICICNDRQSPKVRSLVNSCFDLKFQRPQ